MSFEETGGRGRQSPSSARPLATLMRPSKSWWKKKGQRVKENRNAVRENNLYTMTTEKAQRLQNGMKTNF